jgi:hypothetical protein
MRAARPAAPAPPAPPQPRTVLSRRQALIGFALAALTTQACASPTSQSASSAKTDPSAKDPGALAPGVAYEDSTDALMDVLIPADRDASGAVTCKGAREVSAGRLFGDQELVSLAQGLGYLPALSDDALTAATASEGGLRVALNDALDLAAARERPLTAFKDLPADAMNRVVNAMFDDTNADGIATLMEAARVVAFVAYLGAVYDDGGLVAVGFPPYESFADGLAVSGYPRTTSGRLIDATKEDLRALDASGELDDYTWNVAPPAFAVALTLDARGDLP